MIYIPFILNTVIMFEVPLFLLIPVGTVALLLKNQFAIFAQMKTTPDRPFYFGLKTFGITERTNFHNC